MATPFLLRLRRQMPLDLAPAPHHQFDTLRQIWIDTTTDEPLVSSLRATATQFGETTITETREGTDQPDAAHLLGSPFGETTLTKTSEGSDQPELLFSSFGETTKTATREGMDVSELACAVDSDI